MSDKLSFNNPIVNQLYDIANSNLVAELKTPQDIEDILYPFIRAVIDDNIAYEEAKKWSKFVSVIEHIENNNKYMERNHKHMKRNHKHIEKNDKHIKKMNSYLLELE